MPIQVECLCGAKLEAGDAVAGGTVDCPKCKREVRVPTREWSDAAAPVLVRAASKNESERRAAFVAIGELGGEAAVPILSRGLFDPSRVVVNACLASLMRVGEPGQRRLLELTSEGVLKVSRLAAMVREEEYWDGAVTLADLIDGGKFKENELAELIPLLGEAGKERCAATLKALRKVYPNFGVLIDNAMSSYAVRPDEEHRIPDAARNVDEKSVERAHEMAESRRATGRKGCFGMVVLLAAPAVAGAGYVAWRLLA